MVPGMIIESEVEFQLLKSSWYDILVQYSLYSPPKKREREREKNMITLIEITLELNHLYMLQEPTHVPRQGSIIEIS